MSETEARNTLSKCERLNSDIAINELFTQGQSFVKYPLRIVFGYPSRESDVCRILISVPKKRFKRAVHRNRIKRLVREAYRLNKTLLTQHTESRRIDVAFVYIDNKMPAFGQIEQSVKAALTRVADTINNVK